MKATVDELESSTKQNAALGEEVHLVTSRLKAQSNQLISQISFFSLTDQTNPPLRASGKGLHQSFVSTSAANPSRSPEVDWA